MNNIVSIVSIDTYEPKALAAAMDKCLEVLGGIGRYVAKNGTTVIKPNLLRKASADSAIVTHPNILKIIGEGIIQNGGTPQIADSPGAGYAFNAYKLNDVYREAGYFDIGIPLNLDTSYSAVQHPQGRLIKRFEVINAVHNAASIINVAKLKTHSLTTLTAATKNLFGVIPGRLKIGYHGKLERVDDFSRMLLDLCDLIRPNLSIVDAIVGMEGNGPNMGVPVKLGFIAASEDPVLLDFVCAYLVGVEPKLVPHLRIAIEEKRIPESIDDIKIVADKPLQKLRKNILLPETVRKKPADKLARILMKILRPCFRGMFTVRPWVLKKKCVACGVCIASCPRGAIQFLPVGCKKAAHIDNKKCIRCYCCHEQCEFKAIELKKGIFYFLAK